MKERTYFKYLKIIRYSTRKQLLYKYWLNKKLIHKYNNFRKYVNSYLKKYYLSYYSIFIIIPFTLVIKFNFINIDF